MIKIYGLGDKENKGKCETDSFIHSLTIKYAVCKHVNDKPNVILLPSPERALNSFVFSRVLTDIVAKCHEEQLDHSVQSYIKV